MGACDARCMLPHPTNAHNVKGTLRRSDQDAVRPGHE